MAKSKRASASAIVAWLEGPGRLIGDRGVFVDELAKRLVGAGVPIDRITTAIPILHPNLDTSAVYWNAGEPPVERFWRMQPENVRMLKNSPLRSIYGGGGPLHFRISPQPQPDEFTILPDLRREGFRDYLALPAPFSDGSTKAMTFATKSARGFSDAQVALLLSLMPTVAMVFEIQTLRRSSRALLETYVGSVAGPRVLDGKVKRGMIQTMHAVVWFCDLRGFTALSNTVAREDLIAMLNDFFEVMVDAVEARDGEVLKFIGDAMLAVFSFSRRKGSARKAARRALDGAVAARSRIAELNERRVAADLAPIDFGIVLHVGDVEYGNIGAEGRLDFTVIGPAVNLAARLQTLCAERGETIILSRPFVDQGELAARRLGSFALKGFTDRHEAFTPGAGPPSP